MKRSILAVGLVSLTLAACTNNGPGFGGEPTDPAPLEPHLVLRIEDRGGFVPMEYTFTRQPSLVVMSDGTMFTLPPMIEIYPPPLQTGYEVRTLTQEGLDALIDRAIAAGLTEDGSKDADDSTGAVADASTTVFTFVDRDGTEHEVSAYALGIHPRETAERGRLQQFREDLGNLEAWMPDGSVGESSVEPAQAIRIGVNPYGGEPDVPQEARPWPLEPGLASFGTASDDGVVQRCGILTGADLATFIEAAEKANVLTPWASDGKKYALLLDPLTPDEDATCASE